MILIKIHKSYRDVVAVCDSDLIGKKFEEPFTHESKKYTKQLDLHENFYKGTEYDKEKAVEVLIFQAKEDSTFNIVGPISIKASLEANIITNKSVEHIDGIPYALVLL